MQTYQSFLEGKAVVSQQRGMGAPRENLNPNLFEFQKDIALWAIKGGNRAVFASFGLGKTLIQVQILSSILDSRPGPGLIVCPLGVKGEFHRDGERFFGITPQYVRTAAELAEFTEKGQRFFVTNYERVRDGDLDPNLFTVVSLDEASVLRSYGSKTYQTFLTLFNRVPFKFVCTATPSPNRLKELIHYAGFLGVMDTGQALTRFFKRDSSTAGNLTLHPHKEREFWLWVSTWATFLTKPSDLGYSDEGYDLPPLRIHRHRLPVDHSTAGFDSWGQGKLLRNAALGVSDAAREKRDSLPQRINRLKEIINDARAQGISKSLLCQEQAGTTEKTAGSQQNELRSEPGSLPGTLETMEGAEPRQVQRTNARVLSQEPRENGSQKPRVVCEQQTPRGSREPPAETSEIRANSGAVQVHAGSAERPLFNLRTHDALSSNRSQSPDRIGERDTVPPVQYGSGIVSREPEHPEKSHTVPQFVVWCDLNSEQRAVEALLAELGISYTSLDGSMDIDFRETEIERWRRCETTALVTKPVMYGSGVNLQQCHTAIFLGVGFKFQDFFQAIARIYRFLQTEPVDIHLIYTESEDAIHQILMEKWKQDEKLRANMRTIIQEHGLNNAKAGEEMRRSIGIQRQEIRGDLYTAVNNDNVPEMAKMPKESVDLVVTSWPFSNHYEYTASYNDFGHNTDDKAFFKQMDFLTPHVKRALRPGRLYCVHCKDRLLYGSVTGLGMYSVNAFSDKCVAHLQKHGLIYCGRITVVTDVVRENNQTYRLGWTENSKDGTKMGVGSPEYILLFRKLPTDQKNAYADIPVEKPKTEYTRARWQFDASPFWRSSGNRFLSPDEIQAMPSQALRAWWQRWNATHVYDFEQHVAAAESLEAKGLLPASFMLLDLKTHDGGPYVWDDVVRMRTLNTDQARNRVEGHICPLQIDIVERLIERYSNPGELVLDPFAGLLTVPYCAILKGRKGFGIELSSEYWADGVGYCRMAEQKVQSPTLFDLAPPLSPESMERETLPETPPQPEFCKLDEIEHARRLARAQGEK
jgi:DNA modification methylase